MLTTCPSPPVLIVMAIFGPTNAPQKVSPATIRNHPKIDRNWLSPFKSLPLNVCNDTCVILEEKLRTTSMSKNSYR